MEAIIKQSRVIDIHEQIREISTMFRISKIEKMLSDSLEALPNDSLVNYAGELNRNDVFH